MMNEMKIHLHYRYQKHACNIRRILHEDWEVTFHHIFREANRCVDAFANLGCELHMARIEFDSPPSLVSQLMSGDCRGVSFHLL